MFFSSICITFFILFAIAYVYLGYTKHVEAEAKYSHYMRIGMYFSITLFFISLFNLGQSLCLHSPLFVTHLALFLFCLLWFYALYLMQRNHNLRTAAVLETFTLQVLARLEASVTNCVLHAAMHMPFLFHWVVFFITYRSPNRIKNPQKF